MSDYDWDISDIEDLIDFDEGIDELLGIDDADADTFDLEPGGVVVYRKGSDPSVFGVSDFPSNRIWMWNQSAFQEQQAELLAQIFSRTPRYLPLM